MRRSLAPLVALTLVMLAPGCERAAPSNAAAGEDDGSPRIVALSPAIAIMLEDLGLRDRIIGKHDYDLLLGAGVPAVGHNESIDYERLIGLRPTHVLLQWAGEPPGRLVELSDSKGWAVKNLDLLELESVREGVRTLAAMFPATSQREEQLLTRMRSAWDEPDPRLARAGRVLLLASVDPPSAVGPGSFHHEALVAIGGVPAIDDGSPWMELDAEDVLRLAPDAIVLLEPRPVGSPETAVTAGPIRERLGRLTELGLPAVERGRLAIDTDPLVLTPSTAMIGFAERLRSTLSAWADEESETDGTSP